MTLKIGRQGYLGLGIESQAGTAVPATTAVPFVTNSLLGKHNPQEDIAARGSRAQNYTSIIGKQWSEGEVDVNLDLTNAGFFLKLALGNEVLSNPATGVYDHLFYTTVSGNNPLTATLYNYTGLDVQQFASMAVDKLDLDVKDTFMVAKASFKGFFPTSGAYSATTVSGSLVNFGKYNLKLGSTLALAEVATATPVTEFSLSINNNAEVVFESGKSTASRVFWKQFKVTGSFTKYFESVSERDSYLNLVKSSMILTASGVNLVPGYNEELKINIAKMVYNDQSLATGLENYFAVKTNFTAEVDVTQGKQFDMTLRNTRDSVYT